MNNKGTKPRLLIFIVAYNARRTIEGVLTRIPCGLGQDYDVEVLIIDDSSRDDTFERSEGARCAGRAPFKLRVLFNPVNQGYGGNQKIGFQYAIEQGFDFVALLHGDGQYAPECLPELVKPLANGEADAVLGSRMLTKGAAIIGGMPLYKFVGNKVLTWFQNQMLRTRLSEFHSGYRVYSADALRRIPFQLNTNVFHFDTEIIIQLLCAGLRIKEWPIPTYYGDEICHVNGIRYARDIVLTTLKVRAQELGLFYDRKFDCRPSDRPNAHYVPKLDYESPQTLALATVQPGARVLDLGCGGGYLGHELRRRGCWVTGVDAYPLAAGIELDAFERYDLNAGGLPVNLGGFDYVLMLDVIEHLSSPEMLIDQLRESATFAPDLKLVFSTGNIGFVITRLMLLLGQFNYGKRGILDMTHTRLFTFRTLRRLLEQAGFEVIRTRGVPAPFPLALGDGRPARFLLAVNRALIRLIKSLFAYQIFMIARPRPSLAYLLRQAEGHSQVRSLAVHDAA